ncbi:hypothetical protein F5Y16DRAFT_413737 [Xylariaceae sp. FL0255]|nr:hypothetical protein F5Y16DRAFT_413737 [Xylariaceae sp. FL0255]
MRIRLPFAGAFVVLCLLAAYAGLTNLKLDQYVNDKFLHSTVFFIITTVFYWVIDTSRRRILNFTLIICTVILGIGSEFLQDLLPNGRSFDIFDIIANLVGSLAALGLCSWYHLRMLERKRQRRAYNVVPGDDLDDVELGETSFDLQEEGILATESTTAVDEQEEGNWDQNDADDWEEHDEPEGDIGVSGKTKEAEVNGGEGAAAADKKRVD